MKRLAAVVTALLAFAAATVGVSSVSAPALADPIGQCTASTGTIVAVDYSHWHGPFVRGCGLHSKTGYALLQDADFTMSGDQHDGPAFICRIGNPAFDSGTQYPTAKEEACILTPPASAYWSYWLAPKGQNTWSYSQLGAMSEVPKPGEVELWQFGSTNTAGTEGRPTVTPDELRAHNTAPTGGGAGGGQPGSSSAHTSPAPPARPTTSPKATSGRRHTTHTRSAPAVGAAHATTSAGSSAASTASSAGTTAPTAKPTTASRATSTAASSTTASSAAGDAVATSAPSASGSSGPDIIDAQPASATTKKPATGSAVPVVVGLVIALLLAGGAGVTVLRRRRAETMDS